MTRKLLALAMLTLVTVPLLAALGCTTRIKAPTSPQGPPPPTGPTVTPDSVQAIFTANCAVSGCHTGATPAAQMDLGADSSYAGIVGVPSARCAPLNRVTPNDPDNSCLVLRVQGNVTPRMPLGRPALTAANIATIRNWISQGAPGVITGPAF